MARLSSSCFSYRLSSSDDKSLVASSQLQDEAEISDCQIRTFIENAKIFSRLGTNKLIDYTTTGTVTRSNTTRLSPGRFQQGTLKIG